MLSTLFNRSRFAALPRSERMLFAFVIVATILTMAFSFLQTVTSFEVTLDPTQLILLGLISSVIIQGFKWVAEVKGTELDPRYVRAVVFVVSLGMGWYWIRPEIPVGADPMDLALAIFAGLGVIGGFAKLIYDIVLERVLKELDYVFQFARFKFEPSSRPRPVNPETPSPVE